MSTELGMAHSLRLDLLGRIDPLAIVLSYRIFDAAEATGDFASIRVLRHPVTIGARLEQVMGHLLLGTSLELTADIMTHEVEPLLSDVRLLDEEADVAWSAALGGRVGYRFSAALAVFVGVGLELFLDLPRYVVRSPGGTQTLIDFWMLQPRGLLGLEVDAW